MANTINTQTIQDGERNLVVKVEISGDGSGDEAATQLLDISGFLNAPSTVKLKKVLSNLTGFSAALLWDATTDVAFLELPTGETDHDYTGFGGITNNAGAGVTGDVNITTTGLGNGDTGVFTLWLQKS